MDSLTMLRGGVAISLDKVTNSSKSHAVIHEMSNWDKAHLRRVFTRGLSDPAYNSEVHLHLPSSDCCPIVNMTLL
jgi:hypothetical protein